MCLYKNEIPHVSNRYSTNCKTMALIINKPRAQTNCINFFRTITVENQLLQIVFKTHIKLQKPFVFPQPQIKIKGLAKPLSHQ